MTVRPPRLSSSSTVSRGASARGVSSPEVFSRVSALYHEIAQEQASALGRLGRALETALAALADYEQRCGVRDAARAKLVHDASHALWCFVVQREACGMRDPRPVIRDYRVPAEVVNLMGVFGPAAGRSPISGGR